MAVGDVVGITVQAGVTTATDKVTVDDGITKTVESRDGGGALLRTYTLPNASGEPNVQAIRQRIPAAIAANRTFLALAPPTPAQVAAQVQLLTKEVTALLLDYLGNFTDISGT